MEIIIIVVTILIRIIWSMKHNNSRLNNKLIQERVSCRMLLEWMKDSHYNWLMVVIITVKCNRNSKVKINKLNQTILQRLLHILEYCKIKDFHKVQVIIPRLLIIFLRKKTTIVDWITILIIAIHNKNQ